MCGKQGLVPSFFYVGIWFSQSNPIKNSTTSNWCNIFEVFVKHRLVLSEISKPNKQITKPQLKRLGIKNHKLKIK